MKSIGIATVVAVVLIAGGVWWRNAAVETEGVLSRTGLHWHPQVEIYIKGERFEIPHNIGLGAVHQPIHTHEDLPIIHLEFDGMVRDDDVTLGKFFRVWGKEFGKDRLLEHRSGADGTVSMTVNGEANTEFEAYHMRDGDKIEIRYE